MTWLGDPTYTASKPRGQTRWQMRIEQKADVSKLGDGSKIETRVRRVFWCDTPEECFQRANQWIAKTIIL